MGVLRSFGLTIVLAGTSVVGSSVSAEDLALVLSNTRYDTLAPASDAADFTRYVAALQGAGFRVLGEGNGTSRTMRDAASALERAIADGTADRIVIVLSGHFVRGPRDAFLLGRDAGAVSSITASDVGLSVSALADLAAERPGEAALVIIDSAKEVPLGFGLRQGAGRVAAPQGVTVVGGEGAAVLAWMRASLFDPQTTMAMAADDVGAGVTVDGFVARNRPFMEPQIVTGRDQMQGDPGEMAYWNAVQDIGSEAAMQAYLTRYPNGRFATEAKARITEIREAPVRQAEAIEAQLSLSREARRDVQRNLSLLGFDPKGIDGLFGRGSRAAIGQFQRENGFAMTGYLTAEQVAQLQREGEARAAQLEAEAQRRRMEEERKDRQWWDGTGRAGDEAGLRAYLERYPDGVFAEVAQERLRVIEDKRRAEVAADERAAWDRAQQADTARGYQLFLEQYPRSGFAEAAKARLAELRQDDQNRGQIEADKAAEAQIAANPIARNLIETRLAQLGLDVGKVDGEFTKETRRAIRRFQKAAGLPVTGFVSQSTMVRLLAARRGN